MKFVVFFTFLAMAMAQKAYVRPTFNNVVNVCPSKRPGCHFWNYAGDSMALINAIKNTPIPSEYHVYYGDGESYFGSEITKMVNIVGKCGYGPQSSVAEKVSLRKKKGHTGTAGTRTRTTQGTPICKPIILAYQDRPFFTLVSNASVDASGSCFSNLMLLNGAGYQGFVVPATNTRPVNNVQIMNVDFYAFTQAIFIAAEANFWTITENTFDIQLIDSQVGALAVLPNTRFSGNVITKNLITVSLAVGDTTTTGGFGIAIMTDNAANNQIQLNVFRCDLCSQNPQDDDNTQIGLHYAGFSSVISQNNFDSFGIGARFAASAANNFFEWNNVTASTNHGVLLLDEGAATTGANNILYNVIEKTRRFAGVTIQALHTAVLQNNDFTLNEDPVIDIQNLSPSTVLSGNVANSCVGYCS